MTEPADFDARLHGVAIEFILPSVPRGETAVVLAEDLVAAGLSGSATLAVATLSRNAALSEAEPAIRRMLAEHGIEVRDPHDEDAEYQALLVGFGYWDLPIHFFEGPFYVRIPAVADQSALVRTLVRLLDQRDHATTPREKDSIEQEMRTLVRAYVSPT